jgi:hypothetical protein
MKEKDIKIDFKPHQLIVYAEKDDNSFGPVQTGSYISKNYLDDFRQKHTHLDETLIEKLKAGEISPVYYYMMMEDLSVSELAARTGIRVGKVKKHLLTKHFGEITTTQLKHYSEVFNIPVANLFQLIETRDDQKWKANFEEETAKDKLLIEQKKTNNPFIVETKIEEKNK